MLSREQTTLHSISLCRPITPRCCAGTNPDFYQVIERNLHGVISHPWQGGQYGFVRDPVETAAGTIYTRFHEGMDIRPMRRDARGEPIDEVRAIAAGKVVYVSRAAGTSNYGRYVVVEHRWGGCPYYSLYAHLNTISVETGQTVRRGKSSPSWDTRAVGSIASALMCTSS